MENFPLVSVILPSYNHERYVVKAMESIERQTYPNIEFIIVDDASPDRSGELIEQFCKNKTHKYIRKTKNEGVVKALNDGISLANGHYVAFFASDDIWHPEKIAKQVNYFLRHKDAKIVFTEAIEIDENDSELNSVVYTRRNLERWYFYDVLMKADLPPMSIMARFSDVKAVGGFSDKFKLEDFALWLLLLQSGGYAAVIPETLVYYRSHSYNTHKTKSEMVVDEHFRIAEYFSIGHANRKAILDEWRLRNANFLAGINKRKSFDYLKPVMHRVFDYRLYATLFKYIFNKS